jgi:uncharacterized protein YegP (UPF0339 family)
MMGDKRRVKVFKDQSEQWRWTAYATNGEAVATCGESYVNESHAIVMANTENPDAVIEIVRANV